MFLCALAFIKDDLNLHSPLVGVDDGLCYRSRSGAVGLDEQGLLSGGDFLDDGVRAAAARRDLHLDVRRGGFRRGHSPGQRENQSHQEHDDE